MDLIATLLGPNCKKMECNWAFVVLLETRGIKEQFSEKIFMQHMQLTKEIYFCNFFSRDLLSEHVNFQQHQVHVKLRINSTHNFSQHFK